jgi:DNA polymerase IV
MVSYKNVGGLLEFNPASSTVMHIDLNSCFATVEQQANPFLRGKPVAVAAYETPNGCILAASVEAKRYGVGGVQTGMRVKDGQKLCPGLIILKPDPWKYRNVHLSFRKLLATYTNDFSPKSIDEFVLNLKGCPCLAKRTMHDIGLEIKERIKEEIGDWLTVSIGIAPNRFLAKTASNLQKPNGLEEINKANYKEVFNKLRLTNLCGIKERNEKRLQRMGIFDVASLYNAEPWQLKAAFHSVTGYYWYVRLHGWEIDDVVFGRRSYGNSYSLPQPFSTPSELAPILAKLVTKMTSRLRKAGFAAQGIHLAIQYRNGGYWHKGRKFPRVLFETGEIYKEAFTLLCSSPYTFPVRNLAVSCYDLLPRKTIQLEIFENVLNKDKMAKAMDMVNDRYGEYVVTPARMADTGRYIPDRIAFGNVKELEEFTIQN